MNMPHTHSCVAGLYFHGGNIVEDDEIRGISHLLEHMVFRRCDSVKMNELYRELNRIGVTLHGITNECFIGFYAQASPKHINEVTDMLLRILNRFYWESFEIELEKKVITRQIEEKAEYYFDMKVKEKYYRNTPFSKSIMGCGEDIEKLCPDTINRYKDLLLCCENAAFVLTGNFSETCKTELNNRLDSISAEDNRRAGELTIGKGAIPRNFANRTEEDDLLLNCRSDICDVCISYDVLGRYNSFAVEILTDILAKGDGSKLSWELKDGMGLVGDVWGEIERFPAFSRLVIKYAVADENLFLSLDTAIKIIKGLKENISDEDIKDVINFYTFLPHLEDDPLTYNYHVATTVFGYCSPAYRISDMLKGYGNVTEKEVGQLASHIFAASNMCISICSDNQKIKKSRLKRKIKELRKML